MRQRWHVLGYDVTLTPREFWIGGGVCLALLLVLFLLIRRQLKRWKVSPAVKAASVVALAATGVSLNTSWGFFGDHLGLVNKVERSAIFAVLEGAQVTFALLARENQRSSAKQAGKGGTGTPGLLVWAVSILALYPAWVEAGAVAGIARWLLGPMLAAVLWHFAMGLELKTEKIEIKPDGLVAVVWARAKEQLLARLGAAAPDRTALEIRQDNAMRSAVRYADRFASLTQDQRSTRRGRRVQAKLRDAIRVSEVGTSPKRLKEFVTLLATIRNADTLATTPLRAPWEEMDLVAAGASTSASGRGRNRQRTDPNLAGPGSEPVGAAAVRTSGLPTEPIGTVEDAAGTPTGFESEPIGTRDEDHAGTGYLSDGESDDALATVLDAVGDAAQPGLGDRKGDRKKAFTKMVNELVRGGDLRVWGDADSRVAFAYQVNDALPERVQVTQSTARRYAEDYAKQNARPEPSVNGQIPHQAGSRTDDEIGTGARTS